jgi:hypothetical protein
MFAPFGGTFSFEGARACALNRAAMLVGVDGDDDLLPDGHGKPAALRS